jgi:hypothetical protein
MFHKYWVIHTNLLGADTTLARACYRLYAIIFDLSNWTRRLMIMVSRKRQIIPLVGRDYHND